MEPTKLEKRLGKGRAGMDENAIRQWFIDCFGPIQGEMAWNQFSNMPREGVFAKVIRGGEIKIGDIMFAERAESFK